MSSYCQFDNCQNEIPSYYMYSNNAFCSIHKTKLPYISLLKEENEALKEENEVLKNKIYKLNQNNHALTEEKNTLEEKTDVLKKENEELKKRIVFFEHDC